MGTRASPRGDDPEEAGERVRALVGPESLARLIGLVGGPRYSEAFCLHWAAVSMADQITAFLAENGAVRPVLAWRPRDSALAERLARRYASDFSARDAVLARWLHADDAYAPRSVASAEIADDAYRARLFHDAGLAAKFCIMSGEGPRLVYLNLYCGTGESGRRRAEAAAGLAGEGRILLALLARHLALLAGGRPARGTVRDRVRELLSERYPGLSPRECQVASRIPCGFDARAIALDLGLSTGTVATFRKRAYAKLGISSQAELFACCLGALEQGGRSLARAGLPPCTRRGGHPALPVSCDIDWRGSRGCGSQRGCGARVRRHASARPPHRAKRDTDDRRARLPIVRR